MSALRARSSSPGLLSGSVPAIVTRNCAPSVPRFVGVGLSRCAEPQSSAAEKTTSDRFADWGVERLAARRERRKFEPNLHIGPQFPGKAHINQPRP